MAWYWVNQNNQIIAIIGGDGLIGYGGFYAGNPIWNAYEAENVWAPALAVSEYAEPGYQPAGLECLLLADASPIPVHADRL